MRINRNSYIVIIAGLLLIAFPLLLNAASVKLSWQPNSEPDLNGYNLYYGTQSRNYGPPVPIDKSTNYTLSNLEGGTAYYFAVTAVDNTGNESGFSEEIFKSVSSSGVTGLPIAGTSSSGDDGNVAGNTIDNNLSTRWSASGSGQWIQYDLGSFYAISEVAIAFYQGDARTSDFEILVSDDAGSWRSVFKGNSSGSSLQQETYPTANARGRFLRIVGYGNSANDWNSITEVDIVGVAASPPDTTAPTVEILSPTGNGTYETATPGVRLSGTAADSGGVAEVTWSTSNGGSGAASGTTNWSTPDIALQEGSTTITVNAKDAAGNSAQDTLTVVYNPTANPGGLPIAATSSSADDGNVAGNTVDNNLSTRWSARGNGQWVQYDLGSSCTISEISIAFYKGDKRAADFEILISDDAGSWDSVYKGDSSGTTLQQEAIALPNATGRFVRIVGYGNSANDWNSITEVDIVGLAANAL